MTKKFWADWQRRIGETKQIWYSNIMTGGYTWNMYLLNSDDRLIKANFHNDAVDLVIERHNIVWDGYLNRHIHIENEYKTLHRNEIKTIEFYKYEKK